MIDADNLSKRYRIRKLDGAAYDTFGDALTRAIRNPLRSLRLSREAREDFWALKDVSFLIPSGEVVGIIGRNGSGKSTLLKILSRITKPTEGRALIRGSTASLLEVGTGFHPELTGRENVYFNGAVLGMSRAQIRDRFSDIVEFADVERFLETPVKFYSSGMSLRLAFAVAAHLEPDILMVDEVLAVGDVEFQRKCLGRMHDISEEGRTILFVSHNMGAVRELCSRVFVLDRGHLSAYANPQEGIDSYLQSGLVPNDGAPESTYGTRVKFRNVLFNGIPFERRIASFSGDPLSLELTYEADDSYELCVGFGLRAAGTGYLIAFTHSHLEGVKHRTESSGRVTARLAIPKLAPGEYQIELHAWIGNNHYLQDIPLGSITMLPTPSFRTRATLDRFPSLLMVDSQWTFHANEDSS